jgi:hypothetical protein
MTARIRDVGRLRLPSLTPVNQVGDFLSTSNLQEIDRACRGLACKGPAAAI